jgi:prepilin-type N-terminal cleavage/methylation domain-containing protein
MAQPASALTKPDELLSEVGSPSVMLWSIATVDQGRRGTVADGQSRCDAIQEPTRARRDRGFSIVEVVVTITLMGIVIVPIMSAVATSIKASAQGRSAAQVETALVNAADRVNRAPLTCDYTIYAQAAVQSQGWAANRASVRHSYYVPNASGSPSDPGSWVPDAACEPGMTNPRPGLVQSALITVTSPDGKILRKIQVIKSDV